MIATELEPRLVAYRADMASARDALFGNVLKGVTDWRAPALSLGSLAAMGYTAAIAAFVSTAALTTGKRVIDYVQMRRGAARKHAVSYLVGLADE
jgi:hypothetical protein